jgi:hypothetical protein
MVPLSSLPVPVIHLWCISLHSLCKEGLVFTIIVTARKNRGGNLNFSVSRDKSFFARGVHCCPKIFARPPLAVLCTGVCDCYCYQVVLRANLYTSQELDELWTKDFSASGGRVTGFGQKCYNPLTFPDEDRISRIPSSQPPSHGNGSCENLPLKFGVQQW